jgi:hypothetical protein
VEFAHSASLQMGRTTRQHSNARRGGGRKEERSGAGGGGTEANGRGRRGGGGGGGGGCFSFCSFFIFCCSVHSLLAALLHWTVLSRLPFSLPSHSLESLPPQAARSTWLPLRYISPRMRNLCTLFFDHSQFTSTAQTCWPSENQRN